MPQDNNNLQAHTFKFAQAVREFGKVLPMTVSNVEDLKKLILSSGALGEKFIIANSATNRQEYLKGIHACGQEARVTQYWLSLVDTQGAGELENQRKKLMQVAQELTNIFAKILQTTKA